MTVSIGVGGGLRVVVYDSRIQAMSLPGGDVYRYTKAKTQRAAAYAQSFAPSRTNWLRSQIRTDVRTVRQGAVGRVRSEADYSVYVHEGTGPEIFPDGEFLWVPVTRHSHKRMKRDSVRGQKANPFLERGLSAAMRDPFAGARLRGNPFG